jgi:hypothetical protein
MLVVVAKEVCIGAAALHRTRHELLEAFISALWIVI